MHDVIPLPFGGRAIGNGEQFPGLFPGEPVPQAGSLLADVRDVGQVPGLLGRKNPVLARLVDQLAHRRKPDINGGGGKRFDRGPVLHHQGTRERPPGREREEVVEGFPVVPSGICGGQAVQNDAAQPLLGFDEAGRGCLTIVVRCRPASEQM